MWKRIKVFSFVLLVLVAFAQVKKEFDVEVELVGKVSVEKPRLEPPEKLSLPKLQPVDLSYMLLEPPKTFEEAKVLPVKKESGVSCGEPKDALAYRLGVDYYLQGKYSPAKEELSKVVSMPSAFKPMAEYVLGLIYYKEGNLERAKDLFASSCKYSSIYQKASCESYYALSFTLGQGVPENDDPLWGAVYSIQKGSVKSPNCEGVIFSRYCIYVQNFYQGQTDPEYFHSTNLRRAIVFYNAGLYDQAEEIFKEYAKPSAPYRRVAIFYMGLIEAKRGKQDKVVYYGSILDSIDPQLAKLYYSQVYSQNPLLSRVAYTFTGDKLFLEKAGVEAYNSGDYPVALVNFLDAGNVKYAVYSLIRMGNYEKAYELLVKKKDKDREDYVWLLESAYWSDKDLEGPISEVSGIYPELAKEYTGWKLFRERKWFEAAQYLDDPYYKAVCFYNARDYRRVIETLSTSSDSRALILKAKAYLMLSEPQEVVKMLKDDADEQSYLLGLSYFLMGDYEKAVEHFEKVEGRLKSKALLKSADAFYNLGNKEKALEYYQRVLKEFPDSQEAQNATLSIVELGGEGIIKGQQMVKLIENYLKQNPNSPIKDELKYQLAQAYISNGEVTKAKAILQDLIKTPLVYKALLKLADLEEDRTKKAVFLYKVYKEAKGEEREKARKELINIFAQVGDKEGMADLLSEGPPEDKVKAIDMYISLGKLDKAKQLAKHLMDSKYRSEGFENTLFELYKATQDRTYLEYLKSSPNKATVTQALYLSGLDYERQKDLKRALEDFVDVVVNFPESEVYNSAVLEAAKILIKLNAKKDASCILQRFNEEKAKDEERKARQILLNGLPPCR